MRENKEIREELGKLAPDFVWPENPPIFDVPVGYFAKFPAQAWNKINIISEEKLPLEHTTPIPYQVPDNYFDNLPTEVLKKIKKVKPIARLPRPHSRWYSWTAAAAIALLVALSALLMFQQDRKPTFSLDSQFASLSDAAIEHYLNTETNTFNSEVSYNPSDGNNQTEAAIRQLSRKAIEIYLINNVPDSQ